MTDARPDGQRRATLQDVADRAGVSLTTASRVVNEGARRVGMEAVLIHRAGQDPIWPEARAFDGPRVSSIPEVLEVLEVLERC